MLKDKSRACGHALIFFEQSSVVCLYAVAVRLAKK